MHPFRFRNPGHSGAVSLQKTFIFALVMLIFLVPARAQEDATPVAEPSLTVIPEPMPMVDEGTDDIVNFLLVGAATNNPNNPGLTDSLMIVSANRTVGSVSIVSIPRDLYVYEPGFNMQKINTAYFYGENNAVEGGGFGLLIETIRYNLGMNIDFYARVDFNGFASVIDSVGGIDITVDCAIRDWRLKSPELDKQVAENYEMFILPPGLHHMDSHLALWYVRSRKTSSDLDRGRRQQDVLRALWRTIRHQGIIERLPDLWGRVSDTVRTNLTLADVLGMSPLALSLETSDIEYYTFRQKHEVSNDYSPAGQAILLMNREAVAELMQNVVLPPTGSRVQAVRPRVAVVNASGYQNLDRVVADRLELDGFATEILEEPTSPRNYNHIIDYTGATKGNPIGLIQDTLRVTDDGVDIQPDPNRQYDFKVYVGAYYMNWTCTRDVIQPDLTTPTPETPPGA
jgi:polyisoprenyl-teichoic acid--peptidoglycan teichoic acid transferase